VLLHNAASDAILQAVGRRVTSGDRSHILRLETALAKLDADTEELLERLDASRERRRSVLRRQLHRPGKRRLRTDGPPWWPATINPASVRRAHQAHPREQ
jgi:hypothetical protein